MQLKTPLVGVIDVGYCTVDAHRLPDGAWEVHGVGAAEFFKTMLEDAERMSRKLTFLPKQAFKKPMRAAKLSLKRTGLCKLSDGSIFSSSGMLRSGANKATMAGFSNAVGMLKYGHPLSLHGMDESTAKLVYTVLIEECGAKANTENTFVQAFSPDGVPPTEFRILGSLGFGGKFRYPAMTVDCYPEDMTPARAKMIASANERLSIHRKAD